MVRRVVDLFLIIAVLIAVGFGAYRLGVSVDNTSSNLSKQDSELGQTTYHRANPKGPTKHTLELVGVAVAGAAALMIVVSFANAMLKTRRRQRWHAT